MKSTITEQKNLLTITRRNDGSYAVFVIEGELNEANAAEFEQTVCALDSDPNETVVLEMSGFELADGVAVVTAINVLRVLLNRVGKLKLIAAPQMLGHNLYRVGLLGSSDRIELIAMREEEPYG